MANYAGIDLDKKALAHRRQLGFQDDQIVDMMTLITKMKQRYPEFGYLRIPDDEWKDDSDALWNSDSKTLEMPERTYSSANSGNPRAVMTVVHEVAHALLGHKGILHRAPIGNNAERLSTNVRNLEWQARRYAAAFLIPAISWAQSATPEEISRRYNVSLEAARLRKKELKNI